MATAAAYATAAQSVRPLVQSTAADALYQLESQQIWWRTVTQPSTVRMPAVPTASQIVTSLEVQSLACVMLVHASGADQLPVCISPSAVGTLSDQYDEARAVVSRKESGDMPGQ